MTRLIIVLTLVAALLGLAAWEQIFIDKAYSKMKSDTAALLTAIKEIPNDAKDLVSSNENKAKVDTMREYWAKKERQMSAVNRHMELSYISDALIYAQNFIHHDNKEEACAGLERLAYLLDAYSHIYGINGWNIL